ncbi:hypothetical protein [Streptomyces sp. 049-1]|uniref:hypothetical protein n=1 Tax=Streptomyces sp. 049-1 TaxID=2789264 RepID=UPI003981298D
MVARRPARPPETVADIAARTGRPPTTVSKTWTRHPAWPSPLEQLRGRWRLYDPDAVDTFIRDHIDRQAVALEPRRLYTARELEDAGVGITASTIRADLSRSRKGGPRRWPEPDDTQDGANRWYGSTVTQALADRRGYRRSPQQDR